MTQPQDTTLLTPAEAAALLRTTVAVLANWRCNGRYPALSNPTDRGGAVIKRGRSIFYLRSAVEAFATSHQSAS